MDTPLPKRVTATEVLPLQKRFPLWQTLACLFVIAAIAPLVLPLKWDGLDAFGLTFVSIVLEALPFIMLGSLLGGMIEVFLSRERVTALLPKQKTLAIFVAALLGLIIPVCECAIIPVTRRLLRKGVPFGVALAYLLAGPIVNPLVAASTVVAYFGDWSVMITRLLCGFGIAVIVALLMDEFFPGKSALRAEEARATDHDAAPGGCGHDHSADETERKPLGKRLLHGVEHAADDFLYVSQFLIVGAFIAAMCQVVVDRETLVGLADSPPLAIGLMMMLAVALNLCSEADAFVAASFRSVMPIAAQMGFMVLGPMLDLKLIAMYLSFVRRRALLLLIGLLVGVVFAFMLVLQAANEGSVW